MDPEDHRQERQPDTPDVPALIHDYQAQRDAWRAQARELVRLRQEVLTAADREARDVVGAARAEVRRILLKARRDLLVLTAQVQAATDPPPGAHPDEVREADDGFGAEPGDLLAARRVVGSARQEVRGVLAEARPELEALSAEAGALRAALVQSQPAAPAAAAPHPAAVPRNDVSTAATRDYVHAESRAVWRPARLAPVDRSLRAFVAALAVLAFVVLIGTGWWMRRTPGPVESRIDQSGEQASAPVVLEPGGEPVTNASPPEVPAAPAELSVEIEARGTAWIRATADGTVASERLFQPGETQRITALRDVTIRAGDAGAVFVSVNGSEASPVGRNGQVVTRRFAVDEPENPVASPPPPPAPADVPNRSIREPSGPLPQLERTPEDVAARMMPPQPNTQAVPVLVDPPRAVVPEAAPAPPPPARPVPLEVQLSTAAERWLDAYYRQDRGGMAAVSAPNVAVSDERTAAERLPPGLPGVQRALDDVNVQVFGDNAIVTARVNERMEDLAAGRMATAVSYVSQMWSRRGDGWRLEDVRLVSAASLSRSFR